MNKAGCENRRKKATELHHKRYEQQVEARKKAVIAKYNLPVRYLKNQTRQTNNSVVKSKEFRYFTTYSKDNKGLVDPNSLQRIAGKQCGHYSSYRNLEQERGKHSHSSQKNHIGKH